MSKALSSVIAMAFLSAIGLWMMSEPYRTRNNDCPPSLYPGQKKKGVCPALLNPRNADMDNSKHIDFSEATVLGIALSINNVGGQ
jgi:putative Mn2+ efflux pump MntP